MDLDEMQKSRKLGICPFFYPYQNCGFDKPCPKLNKSVFAHYFLFALANYIRIRLQTTIAAISRCTYTRTHTHISADVYNLEMLNPNDFH